MSGLLCRLGRLCARRRWLVVLVWALVIAGVGGSWVLVGARTSNDIRLPGTETQRATDFLAREFAPQQNGQSPVVFHVTSGTLTEPAVERAVRESLKRMRAVPHVTSVTSPYVRGAKGTLLSEDERTAVAQVLLDVNGGQVTRDLASEVMAAADPARTAGIQVEAGGELGLRLSEEHSRRSEIIGLGAGVVILAITFGTLVAAGMPILTAVVALATGLGLIGLLGHVADIPVVAPTLATMLGLGVGIDYALFIVFRYRDELHGGADVQEAVALTLATSGSAVVFAGITVIIALLALLVANVPMLGAMGYAAALAVAVAVLTAITLLPAVLALVGRRIDALRLPWRRAEGAPSSDNIWARWAGAVTRHPWIALIASLAVLLPLAAPTLTLILGQEDIGAWPETVTQRRAFDLIAAGLGPGANGRLMVAASFAPVAEPSAAYTAKRDRAERLGSRLESWGRRLEKQAKALARRGDALATQKATLESEAAALQAKRAALEARAAPLLAQKEKLETERARLLAEKARLEAKGEALAAEGKALAAEIAAIQQKMAQTTDPSEVAELQSELLALAQQAEDVQAQAAALTSKAAPLERRGERLAAKGRALQAESAGVSDEGVALQAEAAALAAEGDALKRRGERLEGDAADLKREKRRLRRQAKQAKALQRELVRMLTDAGGQPRATDPRVVRLRDALAAAQGVESVPPPSLNAGGSAAVFAITATTRPADPATADLVRRLRDTVVPAATAGAGVTAYVGGVTAAYNDLADLISSRLPLVIGVVLTLSFVVLLVAFRSLLVPVKAILCNLLAVGAAFGILTAFFQWGWGVRLIGLENAYGTVPIASYVPLLMFAVLFGMSTDYEVFLISQIFRAHAAGEGSHEAVRIGVGTSARVITAAAVIMVTVFASFILVSDPVIKEFGVGLSIAILLDATIVRLVIVPSTMVLLGDWNWYLPRWLQWLPRVDLPEERAGSAAATSDPVAESCAAAEAPSVPRSEPTVS